MKKIIAAFIIFDTLMCLLLVFAYGYKHNSYLPAGGRAETLLENSTDIQEEEKELQLWKNQEKSQEELKKICLTFDDGPHFKYTEQLLDGLKERNVKVTFFVTGAHAELHPEIIQRINEEGHLIGNHTYNHIKLMDTNREEYKQEIIRTNEVIENLTGKEVLYMRPPYGVWDKKLEDELNMFAVLWSVDPLDWSSTNAANITSKVVSKAEENDIILMHDYYESTVEAALKVIDELEEDGFTFVTVDELMFD